MARYKLEQVVAESIMVPLATGDQLHMKRLRVEGRGAGVVTTVFMLHGVVEDGRVFYSRRGKGLAYFLATHGFDVFVADLRGKGSSWPPLNRQVHVEKGVDDTESSNGDYGAHEVVTQDLPALISEMMRITDGAPWTWVTHGWGGVLATAYMARYSQSNHQILSDVHFASRRTVHVNSLRKRLLLDWWWGRWAQWLVRYKGYLPARFWGYGVSDEAAGIHQDMIAWSNQSEWIDKTDGFDYQTAVLAMDSKPASLYFASGSDSGLADPEDIRQFMKHHGDHNGRLVVLGKALGNRRDYSAVEMLVHEEAEQDHFPLVLDWMIENGGAVESQLQNEITENLEKKSAVS